MYHPKRWDHLQDRYEESRPRRMLALDGGGIRGLLTLGILERMEKLLAERRGSDGFRLCDYFDYIGGTSTGAIIAAGLARGLSVAQLTKFYQEAGESMFEKPRLLQRLVSFYTADPLKAKLKEVFGAETTLEPQHLRCLLLVVTRNITTDSPWPISSNPDAKYNDPDRPDCNLRIPLWQLVRASSAAPVYFPAEVLQWDPKDERKSFVFVDGGVTPYNNPAFLLYRMATMSAYRLGWKNGERNLLLVSVGTGVSASPSFKANINIAANVAGLPGQLMYGIQVDQDTNCRSVGRCTYGALIDRELYDLTCRDIDQPRSPEEWLNAPHVSLDRDLGRAFLYARYNADLSREGLDALGCPDVKPEDVQQLDSVEHADDLLRVGRAAAAQVKLEHFGSFV
jgi:hypothetical protein